MSRLTVPGSEDPYYRRTFQESLACAITRRRPVREEILDGLADLREKHGFSVISEHPKYRGWFRFVRPGSFAFEISQDEQSRHLDILVIDLDGASGVEAGQRKVNLSDLIAIKRHQFGQSDRLQAPAHKDRLASEMDQIMVAISKDLPELLSADRQAVGGLIERISALRPERIARVGESQLW